MEGAAPHRDERWTMPDAFHVPDADIRCSSARAVIADNSTAERTVAASPEAIRCAQQAAGTSRPDAVGIVMPSASAATANDTRCAERVVILSDGLVRVWLATKPVNFRKAHDGLSAVIQTVLGHDPYSGAVFAFRSKRGDRLKILV